MQLLLSSNNNLPTTRQQGLSYEQYYHLHITSQDSASFSKTQEMVIVRSHRNLMLICLHAFPGSFGFLDSSPDFTRRCIGFKSCVCVCNSFLKFCFDRSDCCWIRHVSHLVVGNHNFRLLLVSRNDLVSYFQWLCISHPFQLLFSEILCIFLQVFCVLVFFLYQCAIDIHAFFFGYWFQKVLLQIGKSRQFIRIKDAIQF